jgi:predicted O-methyltransferase YrrM
MTTSPMVISGLDAGDWVSRYLAANPPIPGWFSDEDVWLFCILDQLQAAAAVQGDLLEIGGYLGKSAVALGYMLRQEETLVVVDPWDSEISDAENAGEQARLYPDVTFDRFKTNYQRFHTGLPDMRRGISSQCLPGLDSARYRFIHVDGSHEWEQVKFDVDEVLRLLAPDGVVAFDDLQAPGVGAAVWPACASGDLVPIATTGKLYATVKHGGPMSAENLSAAIGGHPALEVAANHTIFGSRVLAVTRMRAPADGWPQPLGGRARKFVPPVLLEAASRSGVGAWVRKYRPAGRADG